MVRTPANLFLGAFIVEGSWLLVSRVTSALHKVFTIATSRICLNTHEPPGKGPKCAEVTVWALRPGLLSKLSTQRLFGPQNPRN